jgi:phospholipid/cholesterol/gamma-HCH transport system substrate-binding protein
VARSSIVTVRVGLVIAIAAGIACFAIFSIGHGTRLFKRTDAIEAHFHRINGLQAGAPVELSGVSIGAVDSISFPPDPHTDYVVVKMWIADTYLPRVRVDAVAEINTMGLLGDKFIEITGGNPASAPLGSGQVLASQDPIDYQALLQKQGTSDMVANMIEISQSLRSILDSIDKGHGLLAQIVRDGQNGQPQQLSLAEIRQTLDNMNKLASEMDAMLVKVNKGQGLAGAMFSDKTDGQQLLKEVRTAANSMQVTSQNFNQLLDRINQGNGAVQRLLNDQKFSNELMNNLQTSLNDMRQILQKINEGRGSVGLAVNDPSLYYDAKGFLGGQGSIGWGVRMLNGLYSVTHPFSHSATAVPLTATPADAPPASDPPPSTAPGAAASPGTEAPAPAH